MNKNLKLKKGDKVVMHSCMEANNPKYYGKVWTCQNDSYKNSSGSELVFLEGFSGSFSVDFLQLVKLN